MLVSGQSRTRLGGEAFGGIDLLFIVDSLAWCHFTRTFIAIHLQVPTFDSFSYDGAII